MADKDSASLQRIDAATRKAIHDTFPMGIIMKSGADNPLTIHSADPELFRAIYCLIAETLSVATPNGLDRSTKERIATLVSERNKCPVCIVAHTMMETVASRVEERMDKETDTAFILKHAESVFDVLEDTRKGKSSCVKNNDDNITESSPLDEATKAEIALVVLLFDHMNRVVSAIMGEEMSTAMMGDPVFWLDRWRNPALSLP